MARLKYTFIDTESWWDRDLHRAYQHLDPATEHRRIGCRRIGVAAALDVEIDDEGRISVGAVASWTALDLGGEREVVSRLFDHLRQREDRIVVTYGGIATDERFDSNNNRVANRDALEDIVSSVFGSAPRETVIEKLTAAGIAFGRLTDLEDLAAHPQNCFITVRSDGGEIELMAPGFVTRGAELEYGAVPSLGQHDGAIRAEF